MQTARFFSYAWHIDEDEPEITAIRIYGLDEEGKNVCVRVNNFTPYVYLELPENIPWDAAKAQMLGLKIDELMGNQRPLTKTLMHRKKLYYAHVKYTGATGRGVTHKKYPWLFCSFSTKGDIKALSYKLRRQLYVNGLGPVKVKMHESDASPILQFTSMRNISPAGWTEVVGKRITGAKKISRCDKEFIVKWKNFKPIDSNTVGNPLIMGYDIEVNSTDPTAMPNPNKPGDKVFQISCVLHRHGTEHSTGENYDKYLLTLGDPDPDVVGDDVTIYLYETEADLLTGYTEFIQEHNPNVIVGYNILGFDIPYMIARAKDQFVIDEFDQQGFNKGAHASERVIKWSSSAYKNQEFEFLDAEGRLYVDLLPLVKRDFKMDNYKLKTISTHFLGATKDPLSAKGIFKCYRIGMAGGRQAAKAMGIVGKYCVQDSVLVVQLMNKLQTWFGLCEMAKTCNVPMFTLYTAGQQIKVYSQVYKHCMRQNYVVEKDGYATRDDEHYQGATVFDPQTGVHDNVVSLDFKSLYPSLIIEHNIDYSTLVSDDKVPDRDCNIMEWEDHLGCKHDPNVIRKEQLSVLIAEIKDKIKKVREKRNKTTDKFRKLEYKQEIDELIKSHQPYTEERSALAKKKPKYIMCAKRRYRFLKESVGGKGVLPTILENLLNARAHTRFVLKLLKKLKKEGGHAGLTEKELTEIPCEFRKDKLTEKEIKDIDILCAVLHQRQLSYKISANSMYGAMGVTRGYLPFMPGAMATTAMGRKSIELVAEVIPRDYRGVLIYGDTDSNYVTFPHLKTSEELWDWAIHVGKEVTKLFGEPMELEFEEAIYVRYLILTKKRYMSTTCGRDGKLMKVKDAEGNPTEENKISKKGVLLSRRDNCNFVRSVYEHVVNMIFEKEDPHDVMYFIISQINLLFSGSVDYKEFVITKAVGDHGGLIPVPCVNEKGQPKMKCGDYMVPELSSEPQKRAHQYELKKCDTASEYYLRCLPAQVQLAERMKNRGVRVDSGSRLEYVITTNGGLKAKQWEKIESADYFKDHKRVLEIDAFYYLKALANPLDQVLNIVYKDVVIPKDFVLGQYNLRYKDRRAMMTSLHNLFYGVVFDGDVEARDPLRGKAEARDPLRGKAEAKAQGGSAAEELVANHTAAELKEMAVVIGSRKSGTKLVIAEGIIAAQ
jgi:DNA polymerase elongation subunit (family B)